MSGKILSIFVLVISATGVQAQSFDKAKLAWTLPWDDDWVTAVSFLGNNRVAAGNNLGDILVWDLPSSPTDKAPLPARHLVGHTNVINRLLTTPDQKFLLSASNDHTIRLWSADADPMEAGTVVLNARAIDEALLRKKKAPAPLEVMVRRQKADRMLENHKEWVQSMAQTRDGTLFSCSDKGEVIAWEMPAGKELRRWKGKGWAWALAVHPEGSLALVSERFPVVFDSGRHAGLKLYDAAKGEIKADLSMDYKGQMMSAAAYSPDGKWLAVARGGEVDGLNGKVTLLDPATGKKVRELNPGHLNGATDLAFHPDGKHLFSAGRDTVVKVWSLEDGKHVRDLGTPRGGQFKDWICAVAVSPDGRWLAAADMAGQVQVWALVP